MSRHRETPRDELIAIALDLLARQHPEDLSLREVARRAGLSSGAPAHHFGNKLGLLAASAEVAWAEMCSQIEAAVAAEHPATGPSTALQAQARAYVDYALDNPGPYRLVSSRLFDDSGRFPEIAAWRERSMRNVVNLIPSPSGDPALASRRALAVWALLHGFVTLVLDGAIAQEKVALLTDDMCQMSAVVALAGD